MCNKSRHCPTPIGRRWQSSTPFILASLPEDSRRCFATGNDAGCSCNIFLLHADDVYAVAQGQDNALYPIVLPNHAVELDERLGVAVVVRHGLHHLAIP